MSTVYLSAKWSRHGVRGIPFTIEKDSDVLVLVLINYTRQRCYLQILCSGQGL